MNIKRILKSVAILPLAAILLLPAGRASADTQRISNIKIEGNKAISTATIINRLKIKPGDTFEESAVNNEIKRLYATGYFADVFAEVVERPEGMEIVFTVVEKPIIKDIRFEGNAKLKSSRLEKKISLEKGDLLDFNVLSRDVSEIRNYYIQEGYSRVSVDYRVETDPDTGEITLVFDIDEGYSRKIRSVVIEGNTHMTDAEIKKYMSTKPAFFFLQKGAFNKEKFQADLDRIRMLYRSKGFLDTTISSQMTTSQDGKDIYITVIIDEGKRYLVGEMDIQGELSFPKPQIRSKIHTRPGDPFDYNRLKEDVENVRAFYYDYGYMDADIDLRHRYDAAADRMDVDFNIDSNNIIDVGKINVIGNTKTKDVVIRREVRIYPGERYDGRKLKKSKQRIYNLGFFEDVFLETVPTPDPDVKDLNVIVKETKTGELSFGGGYSSVDSFIGFAQIRQKNFDITNFPTFTGAGQDLTIRGEIGSTRTNYFISWTDPWIFGFPLLFGVDLYREEHDKDSESGWDYSETRTGGSIRFGKEITDQWSTGLIYNLEEVDISDIPTDASQDFKDELGSNYLSRVTWNLQYDSRDNKFSPKKGWLIGSMLENAGGFIGGDKDFVKTTGLITYYHTFFDIFVLELKGRGGVVKEYGDSDSVPIYERFYAGGATTIRGYEQRAVGPRDPEDNNLAIGGRAQLIANAEVNFPIFKNLIKGAVFYDIGAVHEEVSDIFKTDNFKAGAGIGVRVKTPIGPVKLDWGYPLNENWDDKKEGRFYFSVSHGF
jgi:outer membrane protein insertion porin family